MRRLFLAALAAVALAAPAAAQTPSQASGNIAFSTKSIGFIVGFEWGSGTMTLRGGRSYRLRVRTLKAGVIGLEAVTANGRIYNLNPRRPQDIVGTYASIGGGLTVGGGMGAQRMKNEKGVIIEINETAQGLAAKIAASGVAIELVR
ncbi:MAG: hypothetical protein KIT16_00220 [Rhodospirillaceae bacterium]|nr:hypothetical protein [Rhodospirillaceae bacterium]